MRKLAALALALGLSSLSSPAEASTLGKILSAPVKAVFQAVAAHKQDRVFHAAGKAYWATVSSKDGSKRAAIVRVSRGGASKPGKPDILGLAVKIPGEDGAQDQDFLMVTARSDQGLGARVPQLQSSFGGHSFSSLTTFKQGAWKGPLTTKLSARFVTPLDLSGSAKAAGNQSFRISIQRGGLLRPARGRTIEGKVTVHFDRPLTAEESAPLEFTPWHDGGGVQPVGLINALRKPAYQGSELGRGVTPR